MKRTIWIIAVILAAVGGVIFVTKSRPSPLPGLFLPEVEGGTMEFHTRRADLAAEWLLELDGISVSDDSLVKGMRSFIPGLGRSAIRFVLPDSGDFGDRFFWALEVLDRARVGDISSVLRNEAARRGGRSDPIERELPAGMTPLFRLFMEGGSSYWAQWRCGSGSVILVARSLEDLESMTPRDVAFSRETPGEDWCRLALPLSGGGADLLVECSLSLDEDKAVVHYWSNGPQVFLSPEKREALLSMEPVPLYGGGSLAAILGWTGCLPDGNLDLPSFGETLDLGLSIAESLVSGLETMGIDVGAVKAALSGRITMVVGSRASSLMGDIPGGYILLEGIKPDIGAKIVDGISLLLPFGSTSMAKKPGWDGGVSFGIPFSGVVAYGPGGLLLGAMDSDQIDSRPVVPEDLSEAVSRFRYGAFALDVDELSRVLEIYSSIASIFDDDLAAIMEVSTEFLSPWDRLELVMPSLGRSDLYFYRRK